MISIGSLRRRGCTPPRYQVSKRIKPLVSLVHRRLRGRKTRIIGPPEMPKERRKALTANGLRLSDSGRPSLPAVTTGRKSLKKSAAPAEPVPAGSRITVVCERWRRGMDAPWPPSTGLCFCSPFPRHGLSAIGGVLCGRISIHRFPNPVFSTCLTTATTVAMATPGLPPPPTATRPAARSQPETRC